MADASIYEECEQIISNSNSESSNNEQVYVNSYYTLPVHDSRNRLSVDLVQNFPNEFFATLLSATPLPDSTHSLIKVVFLSLEGEFKELAQSALCDTFSVVDLPYEDAAMRLRLKLKTIQPDEQNAVKEQLDEVSSQRRPLYHLAKGLIVSCKSVNGAI